MKQIATLLIVSLFLFSCSGSYKESQHEMAQDAEYAMAPEVSSDDSEESVNTAVDPSAQVTPQHKKIIKDGRMGIRVDELENTKRRIDSLLIKHKGYYSNEALHNSNYETSYYLKIRIPGNNYESFIADIESGKGKILYKEIGARDVTEQFLDIETRLNNKRGYLNRYQELVKQAKTIKEILEIEEYIRRLEEEIESTEGKLRYLNSQVAYSTLELTISKENEYKYTSGRRDNFFERLKEAVSTGWDSFVSFTLVIITIWPFWIVIIALIFLWRRLRKNKKNV